MITSAKNASVLTDIEEIQTEDRGQRNNETIAGLYISSWIYSGLSHITFAMKMS